MFVYSCCNLNYDYDPDILNCLILIQFKVYNPKME